MPSWVSGRTVPCLNIIDEGSRRQVMIPLKDETAESIRRAYHVGWRRYYGRAREVLVTVIARCSRRTERTLVPGRLSEG